MRRRVLEALAPPLPAGPRSHARRCRCDPYSWMQVVDAVAAAGWRRAAVGARAAGCKATSWRPRPREQAAYIMRRISRPSTSLSLPQFCPQAQPTTPRHLKAAPHRLATHDALPPAPRRPGRAAGLRQCQQPRVQQRLAGPDRSLRQRADLRQPAWCVCFGGGGGGWCTAICPSLDARFQQHLLIAHSRLPPPVQPMPCLRPP